MVESHIKTNKTTITVPRELLTRLQGIMKYGDTYGDKINELITLYCKIASIDPKVANRFSEEDTNNSGGINV